MNSDACRTLLITDFNPANFAGALANEAAEPPVTVRAAPYGQAVQSLIAEANAADAEAPDLAVVWTRPEAVVPSFARLLEGEAVEKEELGTEVDSFVALLRGLRARAGTVFVPTWVTPQEPRLYASLALQEPVGVDLALMRMNLRLVEALAESPGIHPLSAQRWFARAGRDAFSTKLWYLSKTPYGNKVFKEAAIAVKSALRGIRGRSRKLVVVDLDDTLWGGIVGDVGWEGITLGGHDAQGEAFVDFQRALKALTRRGVLLGIVSKNEESVALEAIRRHPEMVLREQDFAGWRINWNDKARNVADLVAELNLGLDATLFIDDNPVERARVGEALPEVIVPEWPADKTQYRDALLALPWIDLPKLSDEDRERTRLYVSERARSQTQRSFESLDEWLATLDIQVRCEPLDASNLPRAAQLLNKTNQLNLSTRRLAEPELEAWTQGEGRRLWVFRVSDKFGDSGITGLASLEVDGSRGRIVDFLLSCRVMGRRIEEAMLASLVESAREQGLDEVFADFLPTARNAPCLAFWKASGLEHDADAMRFRWSCAHPYPTPPHLGTRRPTEAG